MALINSIERVGNLLYRQEVVTTEQLEEIRASNRQHSKTGRKPKNSAVESIESLNLDIGTDRTLDEDRIMRAIAIEYQLDFKKLDPLEMDADVVAGLLPKPFALKHMVVPLYRNEDTLTVAIIDPEDHDLIDQIKMVTGLKVERMISTRGDIENTIKQFYGFRATLKKAEKDVTTTLADLGNMEQLSQLEAEDEEPSSEKHIQNAVDMIFRDALTQRASDIHIEPKRDMSLIKLRIDGVLMETQKLPQAVHSAVVSRIKLLARLNISEKRRPQDGRIKVQSDGQEIEMRISVLPVAFGEKIVVRIFDAEMGFKELDKLGFYPEELERYQSFLSKPHGIILVTGPTGSGKTSTLYSSLKYIYSSEKNIVTIEDPIEIVVPDYNQVAIQPAIDLTFASALRSILRQDPDVIMIGEIRDRETAENAVQAALTGHLVLSTLHTNDTSSALTRLYDLGVEPYLVKSTLIGSVAQRLVRLICENCKTKAVYTQKELVALGIGKHDASKLKKGKGCEHCRNTGYYGRTGVQEVLKITSDMQKFIDVKAPADKIKQYACKKGMKTLSDNAVKKMLDGLTTREEALRIFSDL